VEVAVCWGLNPWVAIAIIVRSRIRVITRIEVWFEKIFIESFVTVALAWGSLRQIKARSKIVRGAFFFFLGADGERAVA